MAPDYINTAQVNFVLKQELRTLQIMNDSKSREIALFQRLLKERAEDLQSMYELWRTKMSTNDVPGANAIHNDVLTMGCWAEHTDSSLIFVDSTEGGRVIYSIFDVATDPITEFRDAMPEQGFKAHFSWKKGIKDSVKWTWHDKTPFPWDRIIKQGAKDGIRYASAHDQLNAAQKVAKSLELYGQNFNYDIHDHVQDIERNIPSKSIITRIQNAISALKS